MDVPSRVLSAGPSSPVFKMRRLMVLIPVDEAAWMTYILWSELVACTKTRVAVVSAPVGVVVQSVNLVVDAVKLETSLNVQ